MSSNKYKLKYKTKTNTNTNTNTDMNTDTHLVDTELSILLKSLNKVENYIMKYIYNKYIIETNTNTNTVISNYKYNAKPNNPEDYKTYINIITYKKRKSIITQCESLEVDLENMKLADEEYELNPNKYHLRDYTSLPNSKRCCFIRLYKNKYKRCNNNVVFNNSNIRNIRNIRNADDADDADDADKYICYKHIISDNIHLDKWNKLCAETNNKKKTNTI